MTHRPVARMAPQAALDQHMMILRDWGTLRLRDVLEPATWATLARSRSTSGGYATNAEAFDEHALPSTEPTLYVGLIAPIVKAMQDMKAANDNEFTNLKSDNDNLRHELEELPEVVRGMKRVGARR